MAFIELSETTEIRRIFETQTLLLWYNPKISAEPIFVNKWCKKGITTLGDVLSEAGRILTMREITLKFNADPLDYLTFYRIKLGVTKLLKSYNYIYKPEIVYVRPNQPFYITTILKNKKGIKNIYKNLTLPYKTVSKIQKWDRDLGIVIDEQSWISVYKIVSVLYKITT